MLRDEVLRYIIAFLTRDEKLASRVGYTDNLHEFHRFAVVIIPSGFFDEKCYATPQSVPQLPLQEIDSVPLLFGTPQMEWKEKTLVVNADLIASAYYFITRYEELVNNKRDLHQRFDAKHSLLNQTGLLMRPIVDEYGQLLRKWLKQAGENVNEIHPGFSDVLLTHDVDCLDYYHSWRGLLGGIKRILLRQTEEQWENLRPSWQNIEQDPAYTFPWIAKQNKKLPTARTIYFFKAARKHHRLDRPCYDVKSKKLRQFYQFCEEQNAEIGLHCSYLSGKQPDLLKGEKQRLELATGMKMTQTRYHYLRTCSPDDMQVLADIGITDDYTMAFADQVGFRLGTTRPVKWINPKTKQLTSLTLHPMTLMECTLMEQRYMALNYNHAMHTAKKLIDQVCKHRGELVLLFHNTSFINAVDKGYGKLYVNLLRYINALLNQQGGESEL